MVRKIVDKVPLERLQQDLEKYRQRALELGATDAKIITTDMVLVDERVRAKCIYPKCRSYGTNINCPPYAMDLELVKKVVNKFRYALFTMIEVPAEKIAGAEARAKRLHIPATTLNFEIVSKIEGEAFFDGYHLAVGFAGGPCKNVFCPNEDCSAMVPGKGCRHPLKARSSMEAVGMDAFTMGAKAGWDVYPIGPAIQPADVAHGVRLGLVLIY